MIRYSNELFTTHMRHASCSTCFQHSVQKLTAQTHDDILFMLFGLFSQLVTYT